jgi:hypothetical protein
MRDVPDQWSLGATARRWGGNHTTRYNWHLGNAWSAGADWFFKNVDYDGSSKPADQRFVEDSAAHGMTSTLTVPTIGWVAKDTTSYSFPVSAFGPQLSVAADNPDMGDGLTPGGKPMTPGPANRTSVAMTPAEIGRWVRTIGERSQSAKGGRVDTYILDNEPMLWSETHRDVHPEAVSYDELLQRTIAYAVEIRAADPTAEIAAPALWGYAAMFGSGVDKAAHPAHPDRDRHGGVPFLPWWLGELRSLEAQTGVRLVDIVDIHFYPQGRGIGVGAAGDTDPATSARRIRATRALWDPTYTDESWIAEQLRLVPRVRTWIAERAPGLGISIGEYNFGAEGHMSGGLAVAEALGRFGEQAITSAYYWDYPPKGSPAARAFLAFRNFDGRGGRFLDESIQVASSEPLVSIFASRERATSHLVVVLLDLDPLEAFEVSLDGSSCGRLVEQHAFQFAGAAQGFVAVPIAASTPAGPTLPPYSMTVLDLHFAKAP